MAVLYFPFTLGARRQLVPIAEMHPWNLISQPARH